MKYLCKVKSKYHHCLIQQPTTNLTDEGNKIKHLIKMFHLGPGIHIDVTLIGTTQLKIVVQKYMPHHTKKHKLLRNVLWSTTSQTHRSPNPPPTGPKRIRSQCPGARHHMCP